MRISKYQLGASAFIAASIVALVIVFFSEWGPPKTTLPSSSLGNSGFVPLDEARALPQVDARILGWLEQVSRNRKNRPTTRFVEEQELEDVRKLLPFAQANSASLLKIGYAFVNNLPKPDALLGVPFIIEAESRAEAEVKQNPPPDPLGIESRQVLRDSIKPLYENDRFDAVISAHSTLVQYESDGSNEQYRARLKLSEAYLQIGKAQEALKTIKALVADCNRGLYPTANYKDIAIARVGISVDVGDMEDCIEYLRSEVKARQGTRFETRIHLQLAYVLMNLGRIEEAEAEFEQLKSRPEEPQAMQKFNEQLSQMKLRMQNQGPTTRRE